MFGLLQPCGHVLDDELRDQWRSHLCGVCLALRDGHGQLSRATTNTDTIMVSVLTAAQRASQTATRTAGPCPLRGMRTAEVVTADEPGVALAAAASLALATAKADDVVAEQRLGLAAPEPRRTRAASMASRSLHRRVQTVTALDVDAVLAPLAAQAEIECTASDLDALLAPTADACAAVFAASADRAEVPDNRAPLADIGADFGRLAHLLDAVDDREADRNAGAFNPLEASGTTDRDALDRAAVLVDRITARYETLILHDDRLLRTVLLGGIARAVRSRRQALVPGAFADRCGAKPVAYDVGWPAQRPPGFPPNAPYPPPFKPNRKWYERVLPFAGVTLCGPALCTDHWNHCSDKYKSAACGNCDGCDDCCDCCDCCN
ncbi:DUF5685 family protein [Gordonia sp. (in: high G+C Gram-positive bacteria)]|uniref:DUF5685 family protein n=1 Tax=Gordonia sp. (in: high G+C Gram-positive bacteria) TaxID=84139 RepID=UPI0016B7DD2E|nr:DUF5685 family protein [Gordonia sp. (in: high G+C Gram-positive bacteria)]NLG46838.1 regulator [Gordonia sp. (in: high G+C Gram-positive bacteria)]